MANYILEDQIDRDNIDISYIARVDKYDMYYITFSLITGGTRTIRAFCEKNTFPPDLKSIEIEELERKYGRTSLIADFFVKRLIGKDSLLVKEKRDDFIYLGGNLFENKMLANRYMIQQNGKTGQDNFDEKLLSIKLKVQAIEANNTSINTNKKEGKTYVVGDIHGMYGSYLEVMKRLTPKDHLIILGDVIDRGAGGIQIIQDIMKRIQNKEKNPKITFMIGNHEMQFISTLSIMVNRNLNRRDLNTIISRNNAKTKYLYKGLTIKTIKDEKEKQKEIINLENMKRTFDTLDEAYRKLIKEKGLTEFELNIMRTWLNDNDGNKTIFDSFIGGRVNDVKEQDAILRFLNNSYVVLPKGINGKDYLFVHAMPPNDPKMIKHMKQSRERI